MRKATSHVHVFGIVPTRDLLDFQRELDITPTEFWFISVILSYPELNFNEISDLFGKTRQAIYNTKESLIEKGYLTKEMDLTPLFDKMAEIKKYKREIEKNKDLVAYPERVKFEDVTRSEKLLILDDFTCRACLCKSLKEPGVRLTTKKITDDEDALLSRVAICPECAETVLSEDKMESLAIYLKGRQQKLMDREGTKLTEEERYLINYLRDKRKNRKGPNAGEKTPEKCGCDEENRLALQDPQIGAKKCKENFTPEKRKEEEEEKEERKERSKEKKEEKEEEEEKKNQATLRVVSVGVPDRKRTVQNSTQKQPQNPEDPVAEKMSESCACKKGILVDDEDDEIVYDLHVPDSEHKPLISEDKKRKRIEAKQKRKSSWDSKVERVLSKNREEWDIKDASIYYSHKFGEKFGCTIDESIGERHKHIERVIDVLADNIQPGQTVYQMFEDFIAWVLDNWFEFKWTKEDTIPTTRQLDFWMDRLILAFLKSSKDKISKAFAKGKGEATKPKTTLNMAEINARATSIDKDILAQKMREARKGLFAENG